MGPSWSWSNGSWIYSSCAISAYHHYNCEFEPSSWRGVLDTTLCDKVCQWLARGRWFSPCNLVSSTNKTDRQDINQPTFISPKTTIRLLWEMNNDAIFMCKFEYFSNGSIQLMRNRQSLLDVTASPEVRMLGRNGTWIQYLYFVPNIWI